MIPMPQFSKQVLIVLLVALTAGQLIWIAAQSRSEALQLAHTIQMEASAQALQRELQENIARTQSLAQLFAQEQAALIQHTLDNQGDIYSQKQLEEKIGRYFPDYFSYTLADSDGVPLLSDLTGKVGAGCRRDLMNYAQAAFNTPHAYTPYMHFNKVAGGLSRHFDVMVPWIQEGSGIFFVSIRDSFLQKSMRRHERPGIHLLLLDTTKSRSVELGSREGIVQNKHKRQLTLEEYRQIGYVDHVEGTLWDVAALQDTRYIAEQLRNIRLQAIYLWAALLVIILVLVGLWRRESGRRTKLAALNIDLNSAVESHKQTETELRKLTNYDPLTTLPNRKSINEFLLRALAIADTRAHRPAVLFFDIDRFQEFNDTMGHGYGDVMLKEVADRLKTVVATQDLLARWGGDEFVVVMQSARDENEIAHLAQRLLESMRQPIQLHRHTVNATISLGIAFYPESGRSAEALLKNADLAMYRAKNEGRDRFRFFLQEMDEIANERLRLEAEIRDAIKLDQFVPHFQPRMDLKTGKIVGCEALLRWQHASGLLSPAAFLSTLEETGMIEQVGDAVRQKVCSFRGDWDKLGIEVGVISVNLGGKEFSRSDIVGHLNDAMLNCGLQAKQFEIEITEGQLMENTADSLGKLHALKNMGFSLAIDDFGTGYSSLAYLKRFPVDVIKIDQSFIQECVTSPDDLEIVRTIITLAHSLELRVVAEGVETVAQMELLRSMKCDEVQGYLISKPMSADDYTAFLIDKEK